MYSASENGFAGVRADVSVQKIMSLSITLDNAGSNSARRRRSLSAKPSGWEEEKLTK
jgi:hypothetical protein